MIRLKFRERAEQEKVEERMQEEIRRKEFGWSGAICKECYRPVVGAEKSWLHLDGRVKHEVHVLSAGERP